MLFQVVGAPAWSSLFIPAAPVGVDTRRQISITLLEFCLPIPNLPGLPGTMNRASISMLAGRGWVAIRLLAGMKHLNRLEQVLARSEWVDTDAHQEGLVCDTEGNMVEGVMSNLFFVVDEIVQTPLLANCGVAGVLRRWLLEQFQQLRMSVQEVEATPTHLQRASEVFTCNSVYGVWPVASLGELQWAPGSVVRRAQALFQQHWL
jgi:branched-subunit amino acid aminotransferase/4-amino-4-deoxychorismate lyase